MFRIRTLDVLFAMLLGGCATAGSEVKHVTFPEIQPPPPGPVEAKPYRLRAGDRVFVRFIHNPELNADVTVRADSKISLALVGEVAAAGLTAAELRSEISRRYKDFTKQTRYGELLKEGDDLQLRFVYNPELNQSLTVRPDGKISLPLIGEIKAAGVSPSDLRERLIDDYSKHLRNPDITVMTGGNITRKIFADKPFISVALSEPSGLAVFVGGEVLAPKAVRFDGEKLTALQAIMQAGGIKETGDLSQVVILRQGQFEQAEWIRTNLSDPLSGKSIQNDLVLRDGDVLVVPMSGIAKVNLWVKQYIRDVLPLQSNFSVSAQIYDAGPASSR